MNHVGQANYVNLPTTSATPDGRQKIWKLSTATSRFGMLTAVVQPGWSRIPSFPKTHGNLTYHIKRQVNRWQPPRVPSIRARVPNEQLQGAVGGFGSLD